MNNELDQYKWNNFEEILDNAWTMIERGVSGSKDPFHTPVLGTTGSQGSDLRTVVLRRIIRPERILICHSDLRAAKIEQIRADPRVSWLFYHPAAKVQLRLTGQATLHTDDELAGEQWAATRLMSRRLYCAVNPPGTPSDEPTSGLPDNLETQSPSESESELGRENFAVIACRVDFIDWLYLRARGHRRAHFVWDGDTLSATWVTP